MAYAFDNSATDRGRFVTMRCYTGNAESDALRIYQYDADDRLRSEAKDATGTADDRFTGYGPGDAGTGQMSKTTRHGLDVTGTVVEGTDANGDGKLQAAEVQRAFVLADVATQAMRDTAGGARVLHLLYNAHGSTRAVLDAAAGPLAAALVKFWMFFSLLMEATFAKRADGSD